jgi:hypothetical protein
VPRLPCPEIRWLHEGQEVCRARENPNQGRQNNVPKLMADPSRLTDNIAVVMEAKDGCDPSQNSGQGGLCHLPTRKVVPSRSMDDVFLLTSADEV